MSALLGTSFATLGDRTIPIKQATVFVACVWAAFAVSMDWGTWRLHEDERLPDSQRYVNGPLLELIQPNFDSHRQWYPKFWDDVLRSQIAAVKASGVKGVTDVIWPETAFTYLMEDGRQSLPPALVASIPKGSLLIGGADRSEGNGAHRKTWDSLLAVDHTGRIVGLYDKVKLVPWGEFVPFRWLSRLARSSKDWHHLLELCALFGTLLADQDGIYDPTDSNDRLLLGLK
jgi:apolipoprotein N-acyltransferase